MGYRDLVGKTAPAFELPNYDGQTYAVKPGEQGKLIVLYFYPKSGSMGCTKQMCQARDRIEGNDAWKEGKVSIVGISPDSVDAQKAFVEKQKLTFPVLSDEKGEARKAYSVGKGMLGLAEAARTTFIIDKKGTVRDALEATMNYGSHAKFVDKWLSKLEAEEKNPAESKAAEPSTTETAEAPKIAEPTANSS